MKKDNAGRGSLPNKAYCTYQNHRGGRDPKSQKKSIELIMPRGVWGGGKAH